MALDKMYVGSLSNNDGDGYENVTEVSWSHAASNLIVLILSFNSSNLGNIFGVEF